MWLSSLALVLMGEGWGEGLSVESGEKSLTLPSPMSTYGGPYTNRARSHTRALFCNADEDVGVPRRAAPARIFTSDNPAPPAKFIPACDSRRLNHSAKPLSRRRIL